MAEARIAVAEPRVLKVDEGEPTWKDVVRAWRITIVRRYYRTRNSIRNGTWPTSLSNLRKAFLGILFMMVVEPRFFSSINNLLWAVGDVIYIPKGLPKTIRAVVISFIVAFIFFAVLTHIRQYLLRILLTYRGWMYESPRSTSKLTYVWCCAVRLVSGYQPALYSCQRSLPRMPVPPLKETLSKLFETLKPLCTEDELDMLKKKGKKFEKTLGPKLQKLLLLKSWLSQNYVSDWWEKYAYLRSRSPLPNNSNYYCYDQSYWLPTHSQVSRAATVVYNTLIFKRQIDREELPPLVLRSTVPMCMAQYERIFSTVRIPGEDMDEILHFDSEDSKHILVLRKGIFYKLDVVDSANQLLCPSSFEQQFKWIFEDADKYESSLSDEEKAIAAVTTLERTEWASIRKQFMSSGVNKESLDWVEKSILFVTLTESSLESLTDRGKFLLHGDGKSIWFDKSLNYVIFSNAKAGMNCEHTVCDAPAMAHMWEYAMTREVLERLYDEKGNCMPPSKTFCQRKVKKPQRLIWEVNDTFKDKIQKALSLAQQNNLDLDLQVVDHNDWGKGAIKKCKISPDAFIQLGLQVAYYKKYQKFVQTYEASMTRMYLCGRTETVRSCTTEAVDFVKALLTNNISKEEKIKLFQRAAQKHQVLYRDAMNGKGVDRHLFALYVACKGLGHESEFLQDVITRPWTLSTSQTPHTQLQTGPDSNFELFTDKLSPGGGFGPVSDQGYGVSYIFPNDSRIFFHVSSKHSCKHTDSKEFVECIYESLDEMLALFT